MILTAEQLAQGCRGRLVAGGTPGRVCTDTRAIQPGDWFLAIRGDRFDAHDFIEQAIEAGATGVIAEHTRPGWSAGYIKVADGLKALQNLGRFVRARYTGPVVGITGSAGKTTTRALIGLVLKDLGIVHQTAGNFNNHVGLPLTLLAAPEKADVWVLEMGMNHAGEIELLQDIGRPNIRLITNVGIAHLEGLGSIDAIARAKAELFDGAQPGDICCVNFDDPYVSKMSIPADVSVIGFGRHPESGVQLTDAHVDPETLDTHFTVKIGDNVFSGVVPNPGLHMATNAVSAIAVGYALGLEPASMITQIASYRPVGMRLRIEEGPGGIKLINDAYNANPMSVEANLRMLAAIPGRRRIALLGDMLELGPSEIEQHRQTVDLAESLGLDIVGFAGRRFCTAVGDTQFCAPDAENLGEQLKGLLRPGDIVLIKGSRGMQMERIIPHLAPKEIN